MIYGVLTIVACIACALIGVEIGRKTMMSDLLEVFGQMAGEAKKREN